MVPLKLHVKVTLLVSAAIVAILLTATFLYNRTTTETELTYLTRQAGTTAYRFALVYAGSISSSRPLLTSEDELNEVAKLIYESGTRPDEDHWPGDDLLAVEVLSFHSPGGARDPIISSYPAPKAGIVGSEEVAELLRGQPHVGIGPVIDGRPTVQAVFPITVSRPYQVVGGVAARFRVPEPRLASELNRITVLVMILSMISVAVVTYLMFRRLVYKPVDRLLVGMARVEGGDFSVRVRTQAEDEIGRLTESFNRMIARLGELAEERATYARQLEERVQEATGELGERNHQLNVANVQLFEMQRQLGQLERLATAGQLAAQFAHEVGTPLNLISGHVQLLQAREADERTRKRLEIIAAQITRIERIVRGMLDQTRRPAARLAPVDLAALLNRIYDTIAPTLSARHVELEADIDPELPPVMGDSDQLQQVFLNLVNNSVDAMPDGGRLRVRAWRDGAEVHMELADTGCGISEDDLPRVFDPLFTTKEQGKGAGFGLAVSRQIIAEHGGRITADSAPSEGSTFTITLPVAEEIRELGAGSREPEGNREQQAGSLEAEGARR